MGRRDFTVKVRIRGTGAFVVDELLRSGLYGHTRAEVVERVFVMGAGDYQKLYGLLSDEAARRGYIEKPRKRK